MTRTHRRAHRAIWPILAALVAIGIVFALALKPAAAAPSPASLERMS